MLSAADLDHLRHCVDLAEQALLDGDDPFGSLLVSAGGEVLCADRNRVKGGDQTQHPEFAIVRWAVANLDVDERIRATVYTSGEHCPMCSAAHGWVGLGRIVYATSGGQLTQWLTEWGAPLPPVATLPITTVVPGAIVEGPAPTLVPHMKELYRRRFAPA